MKGPRVELRPAEDADRPFLREVYGSSREDELRPTGWTDDQKALFLDHQFEAQDTYYRANYDPASFDVVLVDGVPSGRLYVARWPEDIRIIDIALLPAARGRGVGTRLLTALLDEARETTRRVSIHVEKQNPALRLYERLGFRVAADRDPYVLMEWEPLSS